MELKPIGYVKSPVSEMKDNSWREVVSEVQIDEELRPGIQGLDKFSHVIIIFYMHHADFDPGQDLVRHPRGKVDIPLSGIFAQRAKHRPNPIGITVVRNMGITTKGIEVRGLDAIDGTPVLDIKPYVPEFDRVDNAITPDWIKQLMKGYF